jgi:hypothetical protein
MCGRSYTLHRDGTVREHWEYGTSHRCAGSLTEPANPHNMS